MKMRLLAYLLPIYCKSFPIFCIFRPFFLYIFQKSLYYYPYIYLHLQPGRVFTIFLTSFQLLQKRSSFLLTFFLQYASLERLLSHLDLQTRTVFTLRFHVLSILYDIRVLCASGTCLAPTEAERRKDCGSATHGTIRRHHSW